MRYREIIKAAASDAASLTEGPDAPLYHSRSADHALRSLRGGAINGRTKQVIEGREVWGISTSRSPRFHTVDSGDGTLSSYGRKGVNVFGACFVINQRLVRQKFRIIPLDWFATNDVTGKGFTNAHPRAESEEFIIAPKLPLAPYVVKFLVFGDVIGDANVAEKLMTAARDHSIPAEFVGQSLSPDGGRHWDRKMRAHFQNLPVPGS